MNTAQFNSWLALEGWVGTHGGAIKHVPTQTVIYWDTIAKAYIKKVYRLRSREGRTDKPLPVMWSTKRIAATAKLLGVSYEP